MKKFIGLFLTLCMCITPYVFVHAVAGSVLDSFTFDNEVGITNQVGGAEAGTNDTLGFTVDDGKLLYDTSAFSGESGNNGFYRTVSIDNVDTSGQEITIDFELKYDNDFPKTYFIGRFTNAIYSNGGRDKTLFTMWVSGKIYVGTGSGTGYQLELGKNYKISMVLTPSEVNGNKAYNEILYVDGKEVGTTQITFDAGTSNIGLCYTSMRTFPVEESKYINTKVIMDNLNIIEGVSMFSIENDNTIYQAPVDRTVVYPFAAKYICNGVSQEDGFTWEVSEKDGKVSVDANGNVSILDSSITSFEIKASVGNSLSTVKTIHVLPAKVYDFQNETVNTQAIGWPATSVVKEIDGNKYVYANGRSDFTIGNLFANQTTGYAVFECDIQKISARDTETYMQFKTAANKWKAGDKSRFENAGFAASSTRFVGNNEGDWFNLKLEGNLAEKNYNVYINGFKVTEEPIACEGESDRIIFNNMIRLESNASIDNIKIYNGKVNSTIKSVSSGMAPLYVPSGDGEAATMQFSAELGTELSAEWSLYGDYAGVVIDKTTGKLIVDKNAETGKVIAMVTVGGVSAETEQKLYKVAENSFDSDVVGERPADTNWISGYGLIETDGNNCYVAPQQNGNYADARYKIDFAAGNLVIAAKIKPTDDEKARIFFYNQNDSQGINFLFTVQKESTGNVTLNESSLTKDFYYPAKKFALREGWLDVKIVMDFDKRTSAVVVNEELLSITQVPFERNDTTAIKQLVFRHLAVDDFKIYNINDTNPTIYNAQLENVAVGKPSSPIYNYLDEGGQPEQCSSYQWYIASSMGGDFEKIEGATSKTYIPNSNDLGKYIKVEITPAPDESHAGSPVMTAPEKVGDIAIGEITYRVEGVEARDNGYNIAYDTEQGISLAIPVHYTGAESNSKKIILAIGQYVNGHFEPIDYKSVTLRNDETIIILEGKVSITAVNSPNTEIKAFMLDETLHPLTGAKYLR